MDRKLPTVLRLLRHHISEGLQAASGVLGAWADRATALEEPALAAAEKELAGPDTDIETLSTLIGILGRQRSEASLPLLARVLRDPNSRNGDVDWCGRLEESHLVCDSLRFAEPVGPRRRRHADC